MPELSGKHQPYYSVDSPELCPNLEHFRNYPHDISYEFNSRGFRDSEWPDTDELQSAIWCIGDSATVGVANPLSHTWVNLLSQQTNRRTINVSMTGASNTWIARRATEILQQVQPTHAVIQWSFFSRRESTDTSLSELDRQLQHDNILELSKDIENFKNCLAQVEKVKSSTKLIHSIVPDAFPGISVKEIRGWWYTHKKSHWPDQMPNAWEEISDQVRKDLTKKDLYESFYWHFHMQEYMQNQGIILLDQLHEDFQREKARDSLHYDIKTAQQFINQLIPKLG